MKSLIRYILIVFFYSNTLHGFGQEITISDGLDIQNAISYDFLGKSNNNYLLFFEKEGANEVVALNEKLKYDWAKEIYLDKRRPQVIGVIGQKNAFCILYVFQKKSSKAIKLHKYDFNCNLIDSFTIKEISNSFYQGLPTMVLSEDKNMVYLFNKKNADFDILDGFVFQLDKQIKLWDKSIFLEEQFESKRLNPILLANNGTVYFISERNSSKLEKHLIEILAVNNENVEQKVNIPLDQFYTYDIKYVIDNLNNRLQAVGLTGDKSLSRAKGIFHITMQLNDTSHQFLINNYPFSDSLASNLSGKKTVQNKGILDVIVDQIILRKDGGLLAIIEQKKVVERRIVANRSPYGSNQYMPIFDHYNDNLLLYSFHPDGRSHWYTVLNKSQFSSEDDGVFNSYFLMKSPSNIKILYNDEIRDNTTISEYLVAPNGSFDRSSVLTTEKKDIKLRFKDGIQLSGNESLIPSENRNKLKIVRFKY